MAASIPHTSSQNTVPGPSLPPGADLAILIIGQTGHGKSATGNSILGEECFPSYAGTQTVTTTVEMFQKEIDGRKLLVVDTPPIRTGAEATATKRILKRAEKIFSVALSLNPEGFHAILLVFRYSQRMTPKEVEAIKEMQSVLGESFIRDHGILLFSYGDDFKKLMGDGESFQAWCVEQIGLMRNVMQEFRYRCVLFDNKGDEVVLKRQRFELVQMIDEMKGSKRYKGDISKETEDKGHGDPARRNSYFDNCRLY